MTYEYGYMKIYAINSATAVVGRTVSSDCSWSRSESGSYFWFEYFRNLGNIMCVGIYWHHFGRDLLTSDFGGVC